MQAPALNVRDMPFRRRHQGVNSMKRLQEQKILDLIQSVLGVLVVFHGDAYSISVLVGIIVLLITAVKSINFYQWNPVAPINPVNRDRLFNSFMDEVAYRNFRFHVHDLPDLQAYLGIPNVFRLPTVSPYNGKFILLSTFFVCIYA